MSVLAPGRNLVLIGMMGSGKSTVGRRLAARLGRPFVDTDRLVEKDAGRAVAEVFAEEGERGFRAREAAAVRAVAALRGQVVSVGGGAVLDPQNVTQLRSTGDLVWLAADPRELARRIVEGRGPRRPIIDASEDPVATVAELAASREGAYREAATHIVRTDGLGLEQVVDAVATWARSRAGLLAREER